MRKLSTLVLVATAGCGRIGFDPRADGGADGDGAVDGSVGSLACNTGFDLGPITPPIGPGTGPAQWFAVATAGTRIIVAETTTAIPYVGAIELAGAMPVLGSLVPAGMAVGNDLQVAVSDQHVLITSNLNAGTQIAVTDLAFNVLAGFGDPGITVSAPDHTVADGNGGWFVASANSGTLHLDALDPNGVRGGGASWSSLDVRGATLTRVGATRFMVATDQNTGSTCGIRLVDGTLSDLGSNNLSPCQYVRVAGSLDGTRIALTGLAANNLFGVTFPIGTTITGGTPFLVSGHFQPARLAADATGFWAVLPPDDSNLRAAYMANDGTPGRVVTLAPYATNSTSFQHDVVTVGDQAYAVWLDAPTSPRLYVEHLCP